MSGAELLGKGVGWLLHPLSVKRPVSGGLSPSRGGTFSFLGTEIHAKEGGRVKSCQTWG